MESIISISKRLQAADVDLLPEFMEAYRQDARSGVQALVKKAASKINAHEAEVRRTWEMGRYEREYAHLGLICGVDEVGRGPLAGPVVAGAVILPKDCDILYLNDSKKLSEKKREELYHVIIDKALAYGLGFCPSGRIDEINILNATYEAMRDAVHALSHKPQVLLNDAVRIPGLDVLQVPIIKGDSLSCSIAAASIIAKVTRDRLMAEYELQFPGYGFAAHKGYGSKEHMDAIRRLGPTPIHRRSFMKI